MAVNQRVARLLMEWKWSRSEAEQIHRGYERLIADNEAMVAQVRVTDRVLATSGNRLSQLAQRTRGQAVPAINDLRDSLREAAKEAERFNEESERGGGGNLVGGRGSRLATFGREARMLLPAIPIPGTGFSTEFLTKLVQIFGTLPPVVLPVVGLLGTFSVAMLALDASMGDAKKALDAAIAANTAYFQSIGKTSDELRQQVDSLSESLDHNRRELANIEQAYATAFAQQAADTDDFAARIGFAFVGILGQDQGVVDRANELRDTIARQEGELAGLTSALGSSATATADNAAAELALAEARQANFDRQIANEVRILSTVPRSTQALEDRLTQINREQEILREYMDTAGLSAEATEQLRQRFFDLGQEESLLSITLRPLVEEMQAAADAAEQEREARARAARDRERLQGEIERISENVIKLETEIADIREKSAEKLLSIEQDRLDKIAEADRDLAEALGDAERDAGEERNEAAREADQERQKAEVEHQLALKRIQDRFNVDSRRAIEDRDAVALFRAQEARDQALSEEDEDHKRRLAELDQQLQDQNRAIDKRLQEQTRTAIRRHEEQLRVANQAAQKAIQLEQARARKEIADRQAAIQILLQQEGVYLTRRAKIFQDFGSLMVALEQQLATQRLQAASGASLATGQPGGGGGTPPKKPPKFDSGAKVTKSGLAVVHAGELILNRRQQRAGGVNINIPINGLGMTDAQLETRVVTVLRQTLREARRSA